MLSILKFKVSKKKDMLNRLLKPALEMKERQEKEFERLGYEKLIEMAYEKSKVNSLIKGFTFQIYSTVDPFSSSFSDIVQFHVLIIIYGFYFTGKSAASLCKWKEFGD
jgi:hypothetical protein